MEGASGGEGGPVQCTMCPSFVCNSPLDLQKHIKAKHTTAQSAYHCPKCKEIYPSSQLLEEHMRIKHDVPREEWNAKFSGTPAVLCAHVVSKPMVRTGEKISVTGNNYGKTSPPGFGRKGFGHTRPNLITLGTTFSDLNEPPGKQNPSMSATRRGYLCRFCPSKDDEIFKSVTLLKQHEALVHDLGRRDIQAFLNKAKEPCESKQAKNHDEGIPSSKNVLYMCHFCESEKVQFMNERDLEGHELDVHRIKKTDLEKLKNLGQSFDVNKSSHKHPETPKVLEDEKAKIKDLNGSNTDSALQNTSVSHAENVSNLGPKNEVESVSKDVPPVSVEVAAELNVDSEVEQKVDAEETSEMSAVKQANLSEEKHAKDQSKSLEENKPDNVENNCHPQSENAPSPTTEVKSVVVDKCKDTEIIPKPDNKKCPEDISLSQQAGETEAKQISDETGPLKDDKSANQADNAIQDQAADTCIPDDKLNPSSVPSKTGVEQEGKCIKSSTDDVNGKDNKNETVTENSSEFDKGCPTNGIKQSTCATCGKTVSSKQDMIDHCLADHGNALPCRFCEDVSAVFLNQEKLQTHEYEIHKLTEQTIRKFLWNLKKERASQGISSPKSLLILKDSNQELVYHCSFCVSVDNEFPDLDQLHHHEMQVHHLSKDQIKSLASPESPKDTQNKDVVKEVPKTTNTAMVPETTKTPTVSSSMEKVEKSEPKEGESRPLMCSLHPQLLFSTRNELINHKKAEHVREYSCKFCSSKFFKVGQLAHHELALHDNGTTHTLWLSLVFGPSRTEYDESGSDSYISDSDESVAGKGSNCKCPNCNHKEFNSKLELRNHLRKCQRSDFHACPLCPAVFKTWKELMGHEDVKHGRKKADVIKSVPKTYKNLRMMRLYLELQDKDQQLENPRYECPLCEEIFPDKEDILRSGHIGHHRSEFYCRFCSKCKFPEAKWREIHEGQYHYMNQEDVLRYVGLANKLELDPLMSNNANFDGGTDSKEDTDLLSKNKCHICGEKSKDYFKLAEHKLVMHDDYSEYVNRPDDDDADSLNTWSDSMSDSSWTTSGSDSENKKGTGDCPFCHLTNYVDVEKLRKHCRTKHEKKYYPCPLCTVISGTWGDMCRHEKECHSRTEKDQIRSFSTTYPSKDQLKIMLGMQEEDIKQKKQKRYECPVCSFASRLQDKVEYHMKKHSGGDRYCRFCFEVVFDDNGKRQKHEEKFHFMSREDVNIYVGVIKRNLLDKMDKGGSRKRDHADSSSGSAVKKRRESKEDKKSNQDGSSHEENKGKTSSDKNRKKDSRNKKSRDGKQKEVKTTGDKEQKEKKKDNSEDTQSTNSDKDVSLEKPRLVPQNFSHHTKGEYECSFCPDKTFPYKSELKDHYRQTHAISSPLTWCKFCNSTLFPNSKFLEIHELVEHQLTKEEKETCLQYDSEKKKKRSRSRSQESAPPRKSRRESDSSRSRKRSSERFRDKRSTGDEELDENSKNANDLSETNEGQMEVDNDDIDEHGEWSVVDAVGGDDHDDEAVQNEDADEDQTDVKGENKEKALEYDSISDTELEEAGQEGVEKTTVGKNKHTKLPVSEEGVPVDKTADQGQEQIEKDHSESEAVILVAEDLKPQETVTTHEEKMDKEQIKEIQEKQECKDDVKIMAANVHGKDISKSLQSGEICEPEIVETVQEQEQQPSGSEKSANKDEIKETDSGIATEKLEDKDQIEHAHQKEETDGKIEQNIPSEIPDDKSFQSSEKIADLEKDYSKEQNVVAAKPADGGTSDSGDKADTEDQVVDLSKDGGTDENVEPVPQEDILKEKAFQPTGSEEIVELQKGDDEVKKTAPEHASDEESVEHDEVNILEGEDFEWSVVDSVHEDDDGGDDEQQMNTTES